jgi:hypothetical protein
MDARKALLVGAAAAGLGGIAAGLVVAGRDAPAPRLSETSTRSAGDLRPPRNQPAQRQGGASTVGPAWSLGKVMRLIDGTGARVGGRRVRIQSETALCSGRGTAQDVGAVRRWRAFDCTYTTFAGGIDRDLEFRVDVLGGKRFRLSGLRWVGGR